MTKKPKPTFKFDTNEMENEFISAIIQHKITAATFIPEILPKYFVLKINDIVFKAIKTYFNKYSSVPSQQILLDIIGKIAKKRSLPEDIIKKIHSFYEHPLFKNDELKYIDDEMTQFIRRSKLQIAFYESIDDIEDADKFNEIDNRIREAVLWKLDVHLGIEITNVVERYAKIEEMEQQKIELPYKKLSVAINHMIPKTVTCFAAQSGLGKSIVLDQIAFHSWKNLDMDVIIISCELSEELKGMRIDSQFIRQPANELTKYVKKIKESYIKIKTNKRLFIKEFPASSASTRDFSQYLHKLKVFYDFIPQLIVVDYLGIVLPNSRRKDSSFIDKGDIVEELRGLSYEYECPLVTASQLQREAVDLPIEEIKLSHISESKKIYDTVDSMIAIAATPHQRAMGSVFFKTLKARRGREGIVIELLASWEFLSFEET